MDYSQQLELCRMKLEELNNFYYDRRNYKERLFERLNKIKIKQVKKQMEQLQKDRNSVVEKVVVDSSNSFNW